MRRLRRWMKLLFGIIGFIILYKANTWQESSIPSHGRARDRVRFEHGAEQDLSLQDLAKKRSIIFENWNDESMVRFEQERNLCKRQKIRHRSRMDALTRDMQGHDVWTWIQKRMKSNWESWVETAGTLESRTNEWNSIRKNILVMPGVLRGTSYANPKKIAAGGPLGELLQWADLIAALYVMGHNVSLESDYRVGAAKLLRDMDDHRGPCDGGYDLIYVDALSLNQIPQHVKDAFRCRFRVLDVFGTHAAYNEPEYSRAHALGSHGARLGLHLKQYYTFYPQTPDNSFLGFVVTPKRNSTSKENMAILYGKDAGYARGQREFVSLLTNFMDVYYTMSEDLQFPTSGRLINTGVLTSDNYGRLLERSKFFVGLGEPIEGTGVMEALAHGCVFLNPMFKGVAQNHLKERKKPTNRLVTSQIPYLEQYIGPPYVHTVDLGNTLEIVRTIKEVLGQQDLDPFIPEEFTRLGFLERLASYVEHQNFCTRSQNSTWPPLSMLNVFLSEDGQSCEESCSGKGQVCEPIFFPHINEKYSFARFHLECSVFASGREPVYPAIDSSFKNICWLQENAMLFSCALGIPDFRRICPCRRFRKHQIALWDTR